MSGFLNVSGKSLIYFFGSVFVIMIIFNFVIPFFFTELRKLKKEKMEEKIKTNAKKYIVPITKGVCSLDKSVDPISTYNPKKKLYVDLPRSVNFNGGAQFSYSFWLRKGVGILEGSEISTAKALSNKIIFYRGNKLKKDSNDEKTKKFHKIGSLYTNSGSEPEEPHDNMHIMKDNQLTNYLDPNNNKELRFIKCPLVKFGDNPNTMIIEFNTIRNPYLKVVLDAEVFTFLKSSKTNTKFNMLSIAFQDNYDFGGVERGIKVDVFIDDALVKTQIFEDNALRINNGPIMLFPKKYKGEDYKIDSDIADLTYYNFALNTNDVDSIYSYGFSDTTCKLPDSWNSNKEKHDFSKINLYNETRQI